MAHFFISVNTGKQRCHWWCKRWHGTTPAVTMTKIQGNTFRVRYRDAEGENRFWLWLRAVMKRFGRSWSLVADRHAKGYKLHALIDDARRLLAWDVRPMKDSEQAVACELVTRACSQGVLPRGVILLGDAN